MSSLRRLTHLCWGQTDAQRRTCTRAKRGGGAGGKRVESWNGKETSWEGKRGRTDCLPSVPFRDRWRESEGTEDRGDRDQGQNEAIKGSERLSRSGRLKPGRTGRLWNSFSIAWWDPCVPPLITVTWSEGKGQGPTYIYKYTVNGDFPETTSTMNLLPNLIPSQINVSWNCWSLQRQVRLTQRMMRALLFFKLLNVNRGLITFCSGRKKSVHCTCILRVTDGRECILQACTVRTYKGREIYVCSFEIEVVMSSPFSLNRPTLETWVCSVRCWRMKNAAGDCLESDALTRAEHFPEHSGEGVAPGSSAQLRSPRIFR